MKKFAGILLIGITMAVVLTGCKKEEKTKTSPSPTVETQVPSDSVQPEITPDPTIENEMDNSNDNADGDQKILEFAALIGKEDTEVVTAFGEGTKEEEEAGKNLLSRAFELPLLNEDVIANVYFDDNQKVSIVEMNLSGTDMDAYTKMLDTALGENHKIENKEDKEEGNESKTVTWSLNGNDIQLKNIYDTLFIHIAPTHSE